MPDDPVEELARKYGGAAQPDPVEALAAKYGGATATAERPVTSIGDLRMRDEAQIAADDNTPLTPDERYEALNPGVSAAKVREANKNVPVAAPATTRPDPTGGIGPAYYDQGGNRVGEGATSDQFNHFTQAAAPPDPADLERRMWEQRFPGVVTRADLRKRKAAEARAEYAQFLKENPQIDEQGRVVTVGDDFVRNDPGPEQQAKYERAVELIRKAKAETHERDVEGSPWRSVAFLRGLGLPTGHLESEDLIAEAQRKHPYQTAGVGAAGFLAPFGAATKGLKFLGLGERAAGVVAGGLVGAEHTAAAGMKPGESGWGYAGRILEGGAEGSAFMGAAGVIGDRLRGAVEALPAGARGPVLDLGYRVGTEIGAFTGADLAVHGDKAALKEDAALAVAFVALGMTPRLAPPRGRGPGAAGAVDTPAGRAMLEMATALETAVPESTLTQRAAFLSGDLAGIPPEMAAKMHVATAPARAAYETEVAAAPATTEPAATPPPAKGEVEPTLFDRPPGATEVSPRPAVAPDVPRSTTDAATLVERTQPTDRSHRFQFDVGLDRPIDVHVVETRPGEAEIEVLGAEPNTVGMTAMRSVLRQVKDAFPDTKFSWDRLTGANPGRRAEGGEEPPPDDALSATARAGVTGNAAGATNAGLLDRLPEPEDASGKPTTGGEPERPGMTEAEASARAKEILAPEGKPVFEVEEHEDGTRTFTFPTTRRKGMRLIRFNAGTGSHGDAIKRAYDELVGDLRRTPPPESPRGTVEVEPLKPKWMDPTQTNEQAQAAVKARFAELKAKQKAERDERFRQGTPTSEDIAIRRQEFQRGEETVLDVEQAPERPALPAPELGRRFATGKRPPKPKEPENLAQFVRRMKGINLGPHLRGEVDALRKKNSGTTGLVRTDGGGLNIERMMQSAKESGFDVDMTDPGKFLERVLENVHGAKEYSREGDAYEDASRRAEYESVEREAMRYEEGDQTFATEEITGSTREGLKVKGLPIRETEKSYIVVDAEGKQHRVDKSTVKEPPPAAESMGIVDPPEDGGPGRGERGAVGGPLSPEERAKVDKTRRVVKRAFGQIRAFHDWVTMQVAPNISRTDKDAGATAGALVGSAGTAAQVGPFWREAVLGDMTPAERLKWDQATTEFQHRTNRERRRAELAAITNPIARIAKQAEIDSMYSTYKDPRAVIKNDAELDAYWNSPEVKRLREKHKAFWQGKEPLAEELPSPEEMYRYLTEKGVDVEDLISTDPRDEMRLNEVALKDREGAETPFAQRQAEKEGRKFTTASSAENIRDKSHPFAREMTSAGKDYLWDYEAKVGETYRRVLDRYLSQRLMDRLVKAGGWKRVKDGTPPNERPTTINGEEAVRIDPEALPRKKILEDGKVVASTPAEHYYGPKSQVEEVKQLLRMNDPVEQSKVAATLNWAALFGVADNAWNLALDTMITTSAPGAGLRSKAGVTWGGLINNLVAAGRLIGYTARKPADFRARNLRLSTKGAFREARTPEWTAEQFKADLAGAYKSLGIKLAAKAFGRLAARVHEAGRYILDDAYTALVKNGMAEDSAVARREFVNRLGQYVGRGMGRLTQAARDSGVLPFVTAQRKGAAEVLRKLSGGAGTHGVRVRIGQAMKIVSALTAIGLWNYMKVGDVRGRPDVPVGSMDLGYDYDGDGNKVEAGKGTPAYSDLFGDLTGVRQAATATGVRAFATAARRGTNETDAVAQALINSWGVKFLTSPTTGFAYRAMTGKQPYYESRPQTKPSPGESDEPGNLAFAAKEAFQPAGLITSATGIGRRKEDPTFGEEVGGIFPSFAPKRGVRDIETLPERIRFRQAAERSDYMISQFKNLKREERVAWIREEMRKWKPEERAANMARLMRMARRP